MKKTFLGYYRPDENEFSELWENAIFVFDANVLLNLYRYSQETTDEIFKLIDQISSRIWIPHQVAYEYQERRLGVIVQQENKYNELQDNIEKIKKNIEEKLLSDRHPFVKDADELVKKNKCRI